MGIHAEHLRTETAHLLQVGRNRQITDEYRRSHGRQLACMTRCKRAIAMADHNRRESRQIRGGIVRRLRVEKGDHQPRLRQRGTDILAAHSSEKIGT